MKAGSGTHFEQCYNAQAAVETVEPVFGIVKHVLGFRQFHLRGHPKVDLEWSLVCLAHNVRRLFKLSEGGLLLANGGFAPTKA